MAHSGSSLCINRPTATTSANEAFLLRYFDLLGEFVAARSTASHRPGLTRVRETIVQRLAQLGFSTKVVGDEPVVPVIIAVRPGTESAPTVGLFAHYDVEEAGDGWVTDPFVPTLCNDRLYARGAGDNLGPLVLRLLALEDHLSTNESLPNLLWIIQGEEEIGSPWAHTLFPTLDLPSVDLWLEETGYFEADGTQRILARRFPPQFASILDRLRELAHQDGRDLRILDRYLNKAFGEARCPCLTHLLREAPYLAIGPNDTRTRIHAANESLPLDTLALSVKQFIALLCEVARCA